MYELGEKSTKFFIKLERKHDLKKRVWKLSVKKQEITDPQEISNNIKVFYETLFKQKFQN